MILIFGGTTEGRIVAKVCDQAAKPYYYATKGNLQHVNLIHGLHLTGAMDTESILDFCRTNNVQLLVDAAHPFAEVLHQNIKIASEKMSIPVVRYERNYPEHDDNLLWFDSYQDAVQYLVSNNINNLLALTGVNTLAKLKNYWLEHDCWFRILDREESKKIVQKENFPSQKVLYYKQGDDEVALMNKLQPNAIITKESGESGGFNEKVKAAKSLNIPILVVKRPPLSPSFISVYGEHGLRKQIENLVPGFFELRTGYTTGTCATAATKAALTTLLSGEDQTEISITLPSGEWVKLPIYSTKSDNGSVSCSVLKDAGDDPDITNGNVVCSTVLLNCNHRGARFLRGSGVGEITLPGLGIKIGEPAINKTPRMMMKREIFKVLRHYQYKLPEASLKTGVDVIISVPNGEEIAKKTFNPKLGIVGGISIIGTSGIVKPFSSEAFVASIRREMEVAKALGCKQVVINSGAKSERFVKQQYPDLLSQAFIHYGNFIGETIAIASDLAIPNLAMGIMIGKAVKLAEGSLDTHSKKVVMNKKFLTQVALDSGCSEETVNSIQDITMARQLWDIVPQSEIDFFKQILNQCYEVCKPLFPQGELSILLIGEDGQIIS